MNYRTLETNSELGNETKARVGLGWVGGIPPLAAEISGKIVTKKLRMSHLAWPRLGYIMVL